MIKSVFVDSKGSIPSLINVFACSSQLVGIWRLFFFKEVGKSTCKKKLPKTKQILKFYTIIKDINSASISVIYKFEQLLC